MSSVFDGIDVRFPGGVADADGGFGARVGDAVRFCGIVSGWRGGQGRPVGAARRGSLDGPGGSVQLSPATLGSDRPSGGPGCSGGGWTQRTSPLSAFK